MATKAKKQDLPRSDDFVADIELIRSNCHTFEKASPAR